MNTRSDGSSCGHLALLLLARSKLLHRVGERVAIPLPALDFSRQNHKPIHLALLVDPDARESRGRLCKCRIDQEQSGFNRSVSAHWCLGDPQVHC